jgi:3-isopropylmalate/(R)-2-methylmalate dehydratase small subunit
MDKVISFKGTAAPLPVKDVDTDMIIPAEFLTSTSRDGYGENVFQRLRENNPDFFMNDSRFSSASILVSDSNFGCGSSREHAVWALMGAGIKAIISKSFADIFSSNAAKNGLVLCVLEDKTVDELLRDLGNHPEELSVDLPGQTISRNSGQSFEFDYDPFCKHCLINGLDDIDYILSHEREIEDYRRKRANSRFYTTLEPNFRG